MTDSTLKIGIAGLGTVGAEVIRLLQRNESLLHLRSGGVSLQLVAVSARDRSRERGVDVSSYRWYDDARELAACDSLDMVVELIGGEDGIAHELCETALRTGKHLVTANKALIASHGVALAVQAENRGRALAFEAAVAGGIPILKTLREGLAANNITSIYAVLNGTSNFILTRMESEGSAFESVLREAQKLGYAESDPTFDIDGTDVMHKLAIMSMIAFGGIVNGRNITVEGITDITTYDMTLAGNLGYVIRLLGIAVRDKNENICARVQPCLIPRDSALNVSGVTNSILLEGSAVGRLALEGAGAGAAATASAVIADIIDIARGNLGPAFNLPAISLKPLAVNVEQAASDSCFVSCEIGNTNDTKRTVAAITAMLDERGVGVASCTQSQDGRHIALIVQQGAGKQSLDRKKLQSEIAALDCVVGQPRIMDIMENV